MLVCLLAQAAPAQNDARWGFGVVGEVTRESWTFRFENPSRYDTAELVPHSFEQRYDTDGPWLGVRVWHPFWHERGELTAAFAPSRTRRADDFDTFFQPGGNIVVTGTTGGASLRSMRIAERLTLARWGPIGAAFEYAYHRHRAEYHDGEGITTTTLPPSTTRRLVSTRETAVGQLHELKYAMDTTRRTGRGAVLASFDVTPVGLARLAVELPDKYPGRLLVFYARVAAFEGRVGYTGERARWSWRAGLRVWRTVSWDPASRLDARGVAVAIDVMPR
jgi:hypothetical protein